VSSSVREEVLSGVEAVEPGKTSAVDRLVEQIRDMISERGLGVGEALQVLRAYGMVETRPKVGAVISGGHGEAIRRLFAFHNGISPDSFHDLQGFRRIIETGVGEHIILTASDADFDRLDAINSRILEAESVEAAAQCDYEFHSAIVELSGNRTTLAAYHMLRSVIEGSCGSARPNVRCTRRPSRRMPRSSGR
jgi:GntR family transcriptional repressor for pyruvate dehydrogenase complex